MERLTERSKSKNSSMVWFKDENNNMLLEPCEMSSHHSRMAIAKLAAYEDAEEQGLLLKLPCKVEDTVYADSTILPIEDMECYEDIENKIPSYFPGRVVSFRFAKRNWMKIAVKTKWLREWIDDETGPESDYIECEKNFTILLSMIGKTVFLTREEAEAKLAEMEDSHDGE